MNGLLKSPCMGCEKRTINCHGNCSEYIKYQQDRKELTAIERRERSRFYGIWNTRVQKV